MPLDTNEVGHERESCHVGNTGGTDVGGRKLWREIDKLVTYLVRMLIVAFTRTQGKQCFRTQTW